MEAFIVRYGLLALFLAAGLEGDASLILGGVVAHLGFFPMPTAIAIAGLGVFTGDCVYYALGRVGASRIRGSAAYARAAPTIERLAQRMGPWEILLARAVWGARNASMVFWGVRGLGFPRFAAIDFAGCLLWACLLVPLGYGLSDRSAALIGGVRRLETWLLGALVVAGALVLLARALARRRLP
jgi:membrane protein DedA with SNARE-associated domain